MERSFASSVAAAMAACLMSASFMAAGCQSARDSSALRLPALYTDTVPCPDCDGMVHQLDLRPDSIFILRTSFLGRTSAGGPGFDEIGRWSRTSATGAITLRHRDVTVGFIPLPDGTLRQVGRPDSAGAARELRRAASYSRIDPKLQLRGSYRETAEGGMVTECTTGMTMRVVGGGDTAALRAAYAKARAGAEAPVLVDLEGRITSGAAPTLIVDRFVSALPGMSCNDKQAPPGLEDAYWKLTRLGNTPVTTSGEREAFFRLDSRTRRVQGSTGCNRISGTYVAERGKVSFGELISTKMACMGVMEQETAFLAVLRDAASWKVVDGALELYDAGGAFLARFEQPV